MGTFVVDLLSGKPLLLNKTFGIASGSTIPVWGGINGDILNQVDLQNQFDTKVNNSFFTGYSATTYEILSDLELNKLEISAFTTYSAETKNRIDYFINDYDSNYKTEAEILALSPSAYTNQKFWASDKKREYISKYIETTSAHSWIETSLNYDSLSDTYYVGTTADGQTTNIGQEIFVNCINSSSVIVNTTSPKVFICLNSSTNNNQFMNSTLVQNDDISDNSIFGVNTTNASIGGYFKLLTYGLLNAVDTSLWSIGTELYVDTINRGEFTIVKPTSNAHSVGVVLKQDLNDGIIFINTIRSTTNLAALMPFKYDYSYFNADIITTSAGTFYLNLRNDKGIITASTQNVIVPDNTIVGVTQDSLSIVIPTDTIYSLGSYIGQIQTSINSTSANEKLHMEIYLSDLYGNVIDSGIQSQIVGDLGVKPILILSSEILNLELNTITDVEVSGILNSDFTILSGQRFRFHIKCEKIGTIGGNKTFTIYYGSIYNTYLRFPQYMFLNDLFDVVINSSGGTFLKRLPNGVWYNESIQISDVIGIDSKLNKSGDTLTGSLNILNDITISGDTILLNPEEETASINFGTPIDIPIPTFNKTFSYFSVIGNGGPNLSNLVNWNINWNLENNSIYNFSLTTNNGIPTYYLDLIPRTTKYLNISNPYLVISGSGFSGLDGTYWVNYINTTDFVMANINGNYTIYMSINPLQYIPQTLTTELLSIGSDNKIHNTGIVPTKFGSYFQYVESTGSSTTTSTSPIVKATLTTNSLVFGRYKISSNFIFSHNSTSSSAFFDIIINNNVIGRQLQIRPYYSSNIKTESFQFYMTLSGVNIIELRYWNGADGTTISDAIIEIVRAE